MGLDTVELVIAVEEKFGISIPNEDAARLYTPRLVIDYLMNGPVGTVTTRDRVAGIVREVIEEETGVTNFHEDSHCVDDMGLD